jgi:monoamine oxidase
MQRALGAYDALLPGATEFFDGFAHLDHWPADPWVRGSYSYYPPGGFTGFGGVAEDPRGGVYFAGEHTARYVVRGTMNGAVVSGERAARAILSG